MTPTQEAILAARSKLVVALSTYPGETELDEPTRLMLEAADLLDTARRMLDRKPEAER